MLVGEAMPDRRLTRRITLADGSQVATIGDASDLIGEKFAATARWEALEHALFLLHRAAETDEPADLAAATDQLERMLHHANLLQGADPMAVQGCGKPEPRHRTGQFRTGE